MMNPNGQMNGPQMNMGMNMAAPNMMPGYQNWTSPQQQGYGYGNSNAPQGNNCYQGWGAPPQAPPPQWSNYNPQQNQGYNNYDNLQYANSTGANSANWTWLPNPTNNTPGAAATGPDIYSRSQWSGNAQSTTGPISGIRAGPGNSASKSGSEYDYGGYGSGSAYDYDYSNYTKEQNSTYAQRSAYGNDTTQPQYPPSQAV